MAAAEGDASAFRRRSDELERQLALLRAEAGRLLQANAAAPAQAFRPVLASIEERLLGLKRQAVALPAAVVAPVGSAGGRR